MLVLVAGVMSICSRRCTQEQLSGNILASLIRPNVLAGGLHILCFLGNARIGCMECCPCAARGVPTSILIGNILARLRGLHGPDHNNALGDVDAHTGGARRFFLGLRVAHAVVL